MVKPATHIDWLQGNGSVGSRIETPSGSLTLNGYSAGDTPKSKNFNFLFYYLDQWDRWAETEIDSLTTVVAGKQASGNYITGLTGDVTASGPGSVAATIAAGAINDSKVASNAAIAFSKMEALSASKVMITGPSGVAAASSIGSSVLSFLDPKSSIQNQFDAKGAKNYISNPSGYSDTTGWAISGAGTLGRTTTAANLPREFTTGSALYFTSSTDEEYVRCRFSLDDVDLSRKLKWVLDYISSTANFRLEMYKNSASDYSGSYTELPLAGDSSGDSYLVAASASANYRTSFDTDSTPYLEARIVHNGAGTDTIYFSDVLVGPGTVEQGAALTYLGRDTSLTTAGFGVISSVSVDYWRSTNVIKARGTFTTGTCSASNASITLRDSLAADLGATLIVGRWWRNTASANVRKTGTLFISNGETTIKFGSDDYATNSNPPTALAGTTVAGNSEIQWFEFEVPVGAWAGSGSLNIGAGAQVEYAYNSDTTDADTTGSGFASGQAGGAFTNVTAQRIKRVQWQTPIQANSILELQYSADGGATWLNHPNTLVNPYTNQNGTTYGMGLAYVSATQTDVYIGQYRAANSTFGAAGSTYASFASSPTTYRWRVMKANPSSPVGFGLAKQTESGLVSNKTEWTSLTSADLTSQGNCSIDSGDVIRFKWKMTDNVLHMSIVLDTITVSNTGQSSFNFTLPSSVPRPVRALFAPIFMYDNSGTNFKLCMVELSSAGVFYVRAPLGGTFTGGTDSCYLYGELHFALA